MTLPLALRLAKNQLVGTAPWLILLTVTLPDASVLRLAKNTDPVVFGGNTYTPFAFNLGEAKTGGGGRIQGISLTVANPERAFQPYLEDYDGLVGCAVTLVVVHADNPAADHSELTLNWEILATVPKEDWITFTLGAENPLRRRFPLQMVMPRSCNWMFKSVECAYAGATTTCARNLTACRALNNSPRFGGCPGINGAPRFVSR